jgi:glycosyltransferase involved in cell wall biosynthesis
MTNAHGRRTDPPKILFVANHGGFFLSHRLPVARAAQTAGYEVHVATPRSKHVQRLIDAGLVWHELPLSRSGLNPFVEARTFWQLYRLYRRVKPDIVDHLSSKPVLYGTLAARIARVPAAVSLIAGLGHVFAVGSPVVLRVLVSLFYRISLRHPRMRVIVESREHRRLFVEERKWIRADECLIAHAGGVDAEVYAPHARDADAEVSVMLAARMLYTKGVGEFVDAARILKQRGLKARFVLIGEPDPANRASIPLETLQRWHDEAVVTFLGRSENMPAVFAATDIVCLPTYYGEGVPKFLIEAGACALPAVTTDWPGCREIVEDGVNGILVPVRDPEAIADAIERLARNRALREEMGRRGREHVLARYSTAGVIDTTLRMYGELLG